MQGNNRADAALPKGYVALPPLPKENFRAGKSDIAFSEDYIRNFGKACQFVCRLVANKDFVHPSLGRFSKSNAIGTGFLVAPSLVLTCKHVIPTEDVAGCVAVQFSEGARKVEYEFARSAAVHSSPIDKNNFSVLRLRDRQGEPAGARFNHYYLGLSAKHRNSLLFEDLQANIIHFPRYSDGQVYDLRGTTLRAQSGAYIAYDGSTDEGSSGAPLFNDYWWLIAMHQGRLASGTKEENLKIGISANAIIDELRKDAAEDVLKELHLGTD